MRPARACGSYTAMTRLGLDHDERLLFATRTGRLFAYGLLSVVLVLYLASLGLVLPALS